LAIAAAIGSVAAAPSGSVNQATALRRGPARFTPAGFALSKGHADPGFFAPNNIAVSADVSGHNVQGDLVGNAGRARNIKSSAAPGYVADGAIDAGAVELYRSGLEYSLSSCCAALDHRADLNKKFKYPINLCTETGQYLETNR
jgi:hypothetical protein